MPRSDQFDHGYVVGILVSSRMDGGDDNRLPDAMGATSVKPEFTRKKGQYRLPLHDPEDGAHGMLVQTERVRAAVMPSGHITSDLDAQGSATTDARPGVWLPVGTYGVSFAGHFPSFDIEVTTGHTEAAPLDLYTVAPEQPGPAKVVNALAVPAGAAPGEVLAWAGDGLAWRYPGVVFDEALADLIDTPGTETNVRLLSTIGAVATTTVAEQLDDDEAPLAVALATKAPVDLAAQSALMTQRERTAKGGRVGVGDKAVVVFRWDDWQNRLKTDVWPLFFARGLPAGHVLISRFQTAQPWGNATTWDDIRDWTRSGIEIWCHGTDHKDPTPDGDAGIYREIVTAKHEIEAQGVKVMGFAPPGTTPVTEEQPFGTLWNSPEAYNTYTGRLIQTHYGISDGYMPGTKWRSMPYGFHHGIAASTITITEGGTTLQQAKDAVDQAIRLKVAITVFGHAGNIDAPGNMTLAQITEFLDYIYAKREAGDLDVLTPSAAFFATPDTENRVELYRGGDFDNVTAGDPDWTGWGTKTIVTAAGPAGENILRIPLGDTTNLVQLSDKLRDRGLDGEVFMLDLWARSVGGASVLRALLADSENLTLRPATTKTRTLTEAEGWVHIRWPFSVLVNQPGLRINLNRPSGGGTSLDLANVRIYKT